MKIQAIQLQTTKQVSTPKLFLILLFSISAIINISAQSTNLIGMDYGVILIPKISSSGVNDSNYSMGIYSETEFNKHWSIGYGFRYLKYGRHIHYEPVFGLPNSNREVLIQKDQYSIHNVGISIIGKYRIKQAGFFIGIQPEKAVFSSQITTQELIPFEDIRNENYPQHELRAYNVSLISGFEFKREFGDRLEFFTRPAVQYFLNSFYVHDGFENTRTSFHLTFGFNYVLTVFADE